MFIQNDRAKRRRSIAAEVAIDEFGHHTYLALGQLVTKGRHAVAAVGYLIFDGGFGLHLERARAEARDFCVVIERTAVCFRPMTDGAVLAKERSLV